jgi:hypothetical protein
METLFELEPRSFCNIILFAFLGSTLVRLFYATWRTFESNKYTISTFGRIFSGIGYQNNTNEKKIAQDHLLGFILGFLELISYPFLLRANLASYIGAWLALKTIHRWGYAPNIKRGFYTRYLISNALVIIISFVYAKYIFFNK